MKSTECKMVKVFYACLLFVFVFFGNLHAATDQTTGISFPDSVSFSSNGTDYELIITGVSTRKKFFVDVYSIASYLQKDANATPSNAIQTIMDPKYAKQLSIVWVRNIEAQRVQDGFQSAFRKVATNNQRQQIEKEINTFVRFFNKNVQKGEKHEIRFMPDGTVSVLADGSEVGTIKSQAFADALLSIWFGTNSAVNRDRLISLIQ